MQQHIVAAMSGGVDSSVVAYLLPRGEGRVSGATMTLYRPTQSADNGTLTSLLPCGSDDDVRDAKAVCDRLGIPHKVYDCGEKFRHYVIEDFVREYACGHTPNPCIVCNKYMKFGALLDAALADGADKIATGHYARIERDGAGRYLLRRAVDKSKDQTYVLWQLSQDVLSRVLLPLGDYRKADIREIAKSAGLCTAHKSDSQDICFVPDGDYTAFLTRYTGQNSIGGDFVDEEGRVLGHHNGIEHYTIGQRKGLGLSLGHPIFVKSKDPVTRRVVLADNDRLFEREVHLDRINLIAADRLDAPTRVEASIRYLHRPSPATVIQTSETTATVIFDEPQRAPAAGQSCVFYDGDTVIGGGIIC